MNERVQKWVWTRFCVRRAWDHVSRRKAWATRPTFVWERVTLQHEAKCRRRWFRQTNDERLYRINHPRRVHPTCPGRYLPKEPFLAEVTSPPIVAPHRGKEDRPYRAETGKIKRTMAACGSRSTVHPLLVPGSAGKPTTTVFTARVHQRG